MLVARIVLLFLSLRRAIPKCDAFQTKLGLAEKPWAVVRGGTSVSPLSASAAPAGDHQQQQQQQATARAPRTKTKNPLWPDGISKEDIDVLVEDVLADPSINIASIPDSLERQIYRSTTILTLNLVYRGIGVVHGKSLLGHEFAITRSRRDESRAARMRRESLLRMKSDVDEDLLAAVADRLLQNKNINQPLVPDSIERAIYTSCLKIVFRILNMLAASFRITLCGHDITLNLNKAISRTDMIQVAQTAANSITEIDSNFLRQLARETAAAAAGEEDDDEKWYEKSPIRGTKREFIVQLHAVLYSLILGIIDDLLANTELILMSDRIHFDIVTKDADDRQSFLQKAKRKVARRAKRREEAEQDIVEELSVGGNDDSDGEDTEIVEEVSSIATAKHKGRKRSAIAGFLMGLAIGVLGSTSRVLF